MWYFGNYSTINYYNFPGSFLNNTILKFSEEWLHLFGLHLMNWNEVYIISEKKKVYDFYYFLRRFLKESAVVARGKAVIEAEGKA